MSDSEILQARILEWVAIPFSRGSSQGSDRSQASLTAGTREAQEYWSGQPIPSPGDLPDPGIEPGSPALQAESLPAELPGKPNISKSYLNVHIPDFLSSEMGTKATLLICSEDLAWPLTRSMTTAIITVSIIITITSSSIVIINSTCLN